MQAGGRGERWYDIFKKLLYKKNEIKVKKITKV
jgi:hypothetical protein